MVREREPLRHSAHTFSLPCASVSYRLDLLVEECICWENSRAQKSCNPPLSPLTLAYNLRGAGHLINSIVTRLHGQSSHHTPIPIAHPQSPQPSTNLSNCTLAIALKKNDRWGRDRCAIFNFCGAHFDTFAHQYIRKVSNDAKALLGLRSASQTCKLDERPILSWITLVPPHSRPRRSSGRTNQS